tara:strand:+ start:4221 stop:4628 length:408 start_codon:yes stop_codon:yes gene_type:complete
MSNERIDLEQFEGMTKGPWRIPEHAAEIVDSEDYAVLWVDFSGESPAEYMFKNSALHCANKEDIEAMAKVPELIAELKRCYEEIDYLVKEKNRLIDIAERGGAWDGGIDISDINEDYGACNLCGSIRSGCCEDAS